MMAMRGRWAEAVELFMAVSWLRVGSGGQGVIGRRCGRCGLGRCCDQRRGDRPGIEWARSGDGAAGRRTRSEEHTSELQSLMRISYAVFCLKKTNSTIQQSTNMTHLEN